MKKLYLLPNTLHEASSWTYTPPPIDALIAESEKEAYAYFKRFSVPKVPVHLLNEHTKNLSELLNIPQETVGLISDAGLPCLADPGSDLVFHARKKGITIEALPGPCSVILALQLSGFSGQHFTFHGYFPQEIDFKHLPKKVAHLFIETPYRTVKVFQKLLTALSPQDQLSLALELMGPEQHVETHTIQEWKKRPGPSGKPRAVFVIWRA
jgi:16S rRNA (cytidine1402-2'-O)-methyltransferase